MWGCVCNMSVCTGTPVNKLWVASCPIPPPPLGYQSCFSPNSPTHPQDEAEINQPRSWGVLSSCVSVTPRPTRPISPKDTCYPLCESGQRRWRNANNGMLHTHTPLGSNWGDTVGAGAAWTPPIMGVVSIHPAISHPPWPAVKHVGG